MAKENNAKRSVPAEIITPEIRSHIESVAADMIGTSALRQDDFDDLCQEMCLKVIKCTSAYDPARGVFYTFACQVLKGWRFDFYKSRIRHGNDTPSIPYDSPDAEKSQSRYEIETAVNSVEDEMRKKDIRAIVASLPPVQRQLCKRILAGQTVSAAAKEMGISKYELFNNTLPTIRSKFKSEGF